MKNIPWTVGAALVAGFFVLSFVSDVDAQRGGARAGGGFSRGGAAAGGGFSQGGGARTAGGGFAQRGGARPAGAQQQLAANTRQSQAGVSRSSAQEGRQQSQAQRQDASTQNQAQRQDTRSQNQAQRQSTATQMQNTRSSTVTNVQSNYYGDGGGCHDCGHWDSSDAAAGFVAGAIVGGTVVAAAQPHTTTVVAASPAPGPATIAVPCNVAPVTVSGKLYYQCGATWYTPGYAANGVQYMPVPPPPGY